MAVRTGMPSSAFAFRHTAAQAGPGVERTGTTERNQRDMERQAERLLALKKGLTEQDLRILQSELHRRQKSTGLTYAIWFFLGWLGIHKFYLGQTVRALLYVIAPWVAIITLAAGLISEAQAGGSGEASVAVGLLALLIYVVWWLVDLFTIPRQVTACNESTELEIIKFLTAEKAGLPHPPSSGQDG